MGFNLRNRSFVKELDFTPEELRFLLKLAAELKAAKYGGYERPRLSGKNIALIFEKTSTRTRTAFEVAAYDQGARVTYLEPSGSQIGHKESMKDTARVLGRTYDGIEYRGFAQESVEILARYAGVPVWNGLTDEFHPTQTLADVLTMTEHSDTWSAGPGTRTSDSCTASPRSTTGRPTSDRRSSRSTASTAWRSPTRSSSPSVRSSSTRPRTACTRSRR
jgi:ornithine carbamoyltransferase